MEMLSGSSSLGVKCQPRFAQRLVILFFPSGPEALNFNTQSLTICNVTPPICDASVRFVPS